MPSNKGRAHAQEIDGDISDLSSLMVSHLHLRGMFGGGGFAKLGYRMTARSVARNLSLCISFWLKST